MAEHRSMLWFITAPIDTRILSVDRQQDSYYIWGVANKNNSLVDREIVLRYTGEELRGDEGDFIGTVISRDGYFVIHFFDGYD